jgi:integrase
MKLDANAVAALSLGGKSDVIYFDSDLPGFGHRLRLGAGGRVMRSWVVQYKHAGRTRRFLVGSAEVLTAGRARAEAEKVLARITLGEDPQGEKSQRREDDRTTFAAVVEEYLTQKSTGKKPLRPRSMRETRRYLTGPYFKALHNTAIDRITRRDVALRVTAITNQSGSPTASRARAVLSALFTWAMKSGITENNPVLNTIEPADSTPRERTLNDAELAAIWDASGDDDYGKIIRLLVLTACRRAEIGDMRWSEFSKDGAAWTLPKERSKNGRAHTLPLPPLAQAIIASVPHMVGTDYLFGSRRGDGFRTWHRGKAALDARCGVADWVVHDIRRTAATRMADIGIQPHIIETILNHVGHRAGVAGVYNRSSYQREVRAALALWADHVRVLTEGGERKVLKFSG